MIEGFRLSPQQKRQWLSEQNGPANLAQCAVLIEGLLDPESLKQAAQNVVDRHEILRTGFHSRAGIKFPFQVVAGSFSPSWESHDLTELEPEQQEAGINRLFLEQRSRALDFEHNPVRFSLIGLSSYKHILVVCLSSLCADSIT